MDKVPSPEFTDAKNASTSAVKLLNSRIAESLETGNFKTVGNPPRLNFMEIRIDDIPDIGKTNMHSYIASLEAKGWLACENSRSITYTTGFGRDEETHSITYRYLELFYIWAR